MKEVTVFEAGLVLRSKVGLHVTGSLLHGSPLWK